MSHSRAVPSATRHRRAAARIALGRADELRALIDEYAASRADPVDVRQARVWALQELRAHGHVEAAREMARQLQAAPAVPAATDTTRLAWLTYGRLLYELGRWGDAHAVFARLAARYPRDADAIGEQDAGERDAAVRLLGAAIEQGHETLFLPNLPELHVDLDFATLGDYPPFRTLLKPRG